jgi:hypothetical protein
MDGIQDMGGMQGFGTPVVVPDEPIFCEWRAGFSLPAPSRHGRVGAAARTSPNHWRRPPTSPTFSRRDREA